MWTETVRQDSDELAELLAISVATLLQQIIDEQGKASLAVSGGQTPVVFFQRLSEQLIDWSKVTITLVDERWLEASDPDSNAYLVHTYLLKNNAAAGYFLPLKTHDETPGEAIMECETQLRTHLERLDVVVLGMGLDGHTASWFPDSEQLPALISEQTLAWCLAVEDKTLKLPRMSLSWRLMRRARKIYLHFSDPNKNAVFDRACEVLSDDLPISHVLHQQQVAVSVYHLSASPEVRVQRREIDKEITNHYARHHQ